MDFGWSEEEEAFQSSVNAFCQRALRRSAGPDALWQTCSEFGFAGLTIPSEFGGAGVDHRQAARALIRLGGSIPDFGVAFGLCAHLFACAAPIAALGSEFQRARYLPPLSCGRWIGANAMTEAEAGSDLHALKATAMRDGDHFVLDGVKSYVTNAPKADVFIVFASTDPSAGYMGLSAFIVERGDPGLSVGEPFDKIGLHSAATAVVQFSNCRLGRERLLGEEGSGAVVARTTLQEERVLLFAAYVGLMQRALSDAVEFAGNRRQFGRPISKNQAVSHSLVDMKCRIDAAELLVYKAAWLLDRGEDAAVESCIAKLAVSEAAVDACMRALRIHGGSGVVRGAWIESALRDAVPSLMTSGANDVLREIVAMHLGL